MCCDKWNHFWADSYRLASDVRGYVLNFCLEISDHETAVNKTGLGLTQNGRVT